MTDRFKDVAVQTGVQGYILTELHETHLRIYDPDGWTSEPVAVTACSVDELRVELDRMLTALEMEVIDGD